MSGMLCETRWDRGAAYLAEQSTTSVSWLWPDVEDEPRAINKRRQRGRVHTAQAPVHLLMVGPWSHGAYSCRHHCRLSWSCFYPMIPRRRLRSSARRFVCRSARCRQHASTRVSTRPPWRRRVNHVRLYDARHWTRLGNRFDRLRNRSGGYCFGRRSTTATADTTSGRGTWLRAVGTL